jgi:hypothetical protein
MFSLSPVSDRARHATDHRLLIRALPGHRRRADGPAGATGIAPEQLAPGYRWYGNDGQWVMLPSDGTVVLGPAPRDGMIGRKFP